MQKTLLNVLCIDFHTRKCKIEHFFRCVYNTKHMDDPIKVIMRYKNNNGRIQYQNYIFIGDVSARVMTALKSIQDKPLYEALIDIDSKDRDHLEKKYGEFWYKLFYNVYHIGSTFHLLKTGELKKDQLIKKYDDHWYRVHIESYELADYKLIYSYEMMVKDERERKLTSKSKQVVEDDDEIDYRTDKEQTVEKLIRDTSRITPDTFKQSSYTLSSSSPDSQSHYQFSSTDTTDTDSSMIQFGGKEESDDDQNEEEIDVEMDTDEQVKQEPIEPDFEEGLEIDQYILEEELDVEELEKMYRDVDPDVDTIKTATLIQEALKNDKMFKKKNFSLLPFDTSKDTQMYDESLKNVYNMNFVTTQYIFKDDTVKMIKNKICCSIMNNSKFGNESYIIPSRQYLWSEYFFNGKVEKVMIGQKWMRRNEILQIDTEPHHNIRIYEDLRGSLHLLRDNVKRYGSKIKRDDDDFNILYDYEGYFTNNEIYMIDLYNELGLGYNPNNEELKNMIDVYLRIYFPRIKSDDIKYVLGYLQGTKDKEIELNKLKTTYETINNDLILENEIMKDVEHVKKSNAHQYIFKENYITQSVIHLNLRLKEGFKLDLHRIFDTFEASNTYPFIQYQTPDGVIHFRYNTDSILKYQQSKENVDILTKWFENSPYGISFKVRIQEKGVEKFMAITLNDNGRIEYKTQWKEEDMATIKDVQNTYTYVKQLLLKINQEKNRVQFESPQDQEFRYAFINTIKKFELPENFIINHNDLSEFSRYFFPYVALVIEPRKRQSKINKDNTISKFGTYLRYKRISKYENQTRIEQRILYFMRNYDYNDQSLANEISKQFNITEEKAMDDIEKVRNKYPNTKKSRKVLKKLENIPKYKPPGIGIDVQGKHRDNYKIRISGARNKQQLDRIINFMNILIYLYVDTYLYKRPDRQQLKAKLSKLTNIARRRNRVVEIVKRDSDIKTIKHMTQLDKKRIGFKPEKGQNQWTRSCQNSGDDKKRRPQQFHGANIDDMLKKGYKFNSKTGFYEKKVNTKIGRRNINTTIRAVKLQDIDETGNPTGDHIYYTCSPEENGEHMYIGFLTRSNNPYGHCMPCCFKKDPLTSRNKEKKEYFIKCIGETNEKRRDTGKIIGDILYILQDTNKIQEGRFGFLPKYLDFFFNTLLDNIRYIKYHYLITAPNGYFFKYGSRQDEYPFLNAIVALFDTTIDEIKNKCIVTLENDKTDQIFTFLNNGDVKTQFGTRDEYINFIRSSSYLDFDIINNLISIPGILSNARVNIIIFNKTINIVRKSLEKEKIKEDFIVMCQNTEEPYNITEEGRDTVFILKENKNYYPIVMVTKKNDVNKDIEIKKIFKLDMNNPKNIVLHVSEFYKRNCYVGVVTDINYQKSSLIAKQAYHHLSSLTKEYQPKYQLIDNRNKCKYIITQSGLIVPVKPSGSIYNLQIIRNIESQIKSLTETIKQLEQLFIKSDKNLLTNPIGVYYDRKKNNKLHVVAVITKTYDIVPVKEEEIDASKIEEMGLISENQPLYDMIDKKIMKGRSNVVSDEGVESVSHAKYLDESYELFRLHFSEYISSSNNENIRNKFLKIIDSNKLNKNKKKKRDEIRKILYKIIDKDMFQLYIAHLGKQPEPNDAEFDIQEGGKIEKFVHIVNRVPDTINYDTINNRDVCEIHTKEQCADNFHCHWAYNECHLGITRKMAIEFINRLSEEIVENNLKKMELFREGDYFVSDIVDYNRFAERRGQKIIKSTNANLNRVLEELFGKENVPTIGKRRGMKLFDNSYLQTTINYPIKDMQEFYIQNIIENNNTLFRAYVNGMYWIKHPYDNIISRNLGYYSPIQTDLSNFFKSLVIDWLLDEKRKNEVLDLIERNYLFKKPYKGTNNLP